MLLLFAQQPKGPPPEAVGGILAGLAGIWLGVVCVAVLISVIGIGFLIWYALTANKALTAVSEKNRAVAPGMAFLVFLFFVPGIGPILLLVMFIMIALWVSASLEKEFESRGLKAEGDFGKLMGILMIIPCVGFLPLPIITYLWISKIKAYTAQLEGGGSKKGYSDED